MKIVADETGKILGVHIAGPEASELINEASLALQQGATLSDLAQVIHQHPTLAEGLAEAAEVALGRAIHTIMR